MYNSVHLPAKTSAHHLSYYLGQQECISPAVTALATSTLATTASTANTQGTIYILHLVFYIIIVLEMCVGVIVM